MQQRSLHWIIPSQFHQKPEGFHYHSWPMHRQTPYGLWQQLGHILETDLCVLKCCCLNQWSVDLLLVTNSQNHWYQLNNHLPWHHLISKEQGQLLYPIWKPPHQDHQMQQYCSKMHDTKRGSENENSNDSTETTCPKAIFAIKLNIKLK